MQGLRAMFVLLAAAFVVEAGLAFWVAESLPNGGPARSGFDAFDGLFWLHHGLMLAALVRGIGAHRIGPAAMVPVLLVTAPLLWLLQAAGWLVLTVLTARNHARRANPRSLEAALGYLLLAASFASMTWLATPLGGRPWLSSILSILGLALLWHGIPRRPRLG